MIEYIIERKDRNMYAIGNKKMLNMLILDILK